MEIPVSSILIGSPTPDSEAYLTAIKDLAESIEEHGLSHAIIVRSANISPEGAQQYHLVSGEKRLRAVKLLGRETIESIVREVNEDTGQSIRIHENLKRAQLPWPEQVILVEQLHRLRIKEAGGNPDEARSQGRPRKSDAPTWSQRDTAEELGMALGAVSDDLMLARAVRADSSLRNVSDKKTAVRLVRQAARRMVNEVESGAPKEEEFNVVYCGDSASVLSKLPANSVDHVISDPPWLKFFEAERTYDERTVPVFKECFRVLKPNAFLLFFCGFDDYVYYCGFDLPKAGNSRELVHTPGVLENIGFSVTKTPAIWRKRNALSRRGVRPWEYDRDFEFIVVAVKGSPLMVSSNQPSAFKEAAIVNPRMMLHPHEKPVDLIESLIKDISYEGNVILDPFGGSGVTAEACKKLKRKFIICEREAEQYQKICARLKVAP